MILLLKIALSHNASYVSSLGNVKASDDQIYAYSTVLTDTLSTNKLSNYFSGKTCNGTDCIVSASCNTSNGWYSTTSSVGTYRRSVSVTNTAKAQYAKGTDLTCYHKAQCSDYKGYAASCPSGQTGTKVTMSGTNGLQCYKKADCHCNDGYYYYSDPDAQFDWEAYEYKGQDKEPLNKPYYAGTTYTNINSSWWSTYCSERCHDGLCYMGDDSSQWAFYSTAYGNCYDANPAGCYKPSCPNINLKNPDGEESGIYFDASQTPVGTSFSYLSKIDTVARQIPLNCSKRFWPTHIVFDYTYTSATVDGTEGVCLKLTKNVHLYRETEDVSQNFALKVDCTESTHGGGCNDGFRFSGARQTEYDPWNSSHPDIYCAYTGSITMSTVGSSSTDKLYCSTSYTMISYENPVVSSNDTDNVCLDRTNIRTGWQCFPLAGISMKIAYRKTSTSGGRLYTRVHNGATSQLSLDEETNEYYIDTRPGCSLYLKLTTEGQQAYGMYVTSTWTSTSDAGGVELYMRYDRSF